MNRGAPTVHGTTYTFAFGDTVFAVDASKAGRIVTFSLAGKNILTAPKDSGDNNWGSTFWTSPQSDWNWPPPSEIDPGAYSAQMVGGALSLTSNPANGLGLAVTKKFSVDAVAGAVIAEYGIVNRGAQARAAAPWEITRVAAGGLTFFPMGEGCPRKGFQDLLSLQQARGVAWFPYDAGTIAADQKVFADGHEGWIAHVAGDLLLVKAFTDIPAEKAAPGEAEIEIYTDAGHSYIEVENQGACVSLAPGASLSWTVRWFLRRLDRSVAVQVGNAALLAAVRSLAKG
jgi:hypothetical protein